MLDWISGNVWVIWLALAAGLSITEMITLDFTLLMLATGALAGFGVALLFPGLVWLQIALAVVVAVAMLGLLRPTLLRKVRSMPGYRSSLDKMVGSAGIAVTAITATAGEVKVAGETWSARSLDGDVIAAGSQVEVYEIDGVVAVVYPRRRELP